jgi:hypothetical protein
MLNYADALIKAQRIGPSRAEGDADLAQTCSALASVHAINPQMWFEAAQRKKLSATDLAQLANTNLGTFAFLPWE